MFVCAIRLRLVFSSELPGDTKDSHTYRESHNSITAVESVFTNVPVDRTLHLILDRVYRCEETPQLDIPEEHLRTLLEICTKEAPFLSPRGELYRQVDKVAMGSPRRVLFANFYLGGIESASLNNHRPSIYGRYIDDIFVRVQNTQELRELKQRLANDSALNFTFEESKEGRLPSLDVLVSVCGSRLSTMVYLKETNQGLCLIGNSECSRRYLLSTIKTYIRRVLTHCSS